MIDFKNILVIIFISFSCSGDSEVFFDPSYWSEPYKGITHTNNSGLIQKSGDSDWCFQESIYSEGYAFLPAYPNPVDREEENLTIVFFTRDTSRIRIQIDNGRDNSLIIFTDSTFSRGLYELKWDLKDNRGIKVPGGIYRCFMYANNFSCFGDIWIK